MSSSSFFTGWGYPRDGPPCPAGHDGRVSGGPGRVLGVDGCAAGWVAVAMPGPAACAGPGIGAVVDQAVADGPLAVIAIDMPAGLADAGRRPADVLARRDLGPRWASIFLTPVRAALAAAGPGASHAERYRAASEASRRVAGEGISRQAFALLPKIAEVDGWIRDAPARVVEAHPELSFATLAGAPLATRKPTWAGAAQRHALLAAAGIVLPGDLGPAGTLAGVDDVLDAAVLAWTARRVADGTARPRPDPPDVFSDGLPCAIWA
jgi:predicted RNase H-like nuclease